MSEKTHKILANICIAIFVIAALALLYASTRVRVSNEYQYPLSHYLTNEETEAEPTHIIYGSLFERPSNDNSEAGNNLLDEDLVIMSVHGDFPIYNSIADLSYRATDIVQVEVLDERVEWINIWMPPQDENALSHFTAEEMEEYYFLFEAYYIFTVYRLRVLDVFMGDSAPGDILEVKLIGGQIDNTILINDDYVPFAIGEVVVLFLKTYDMEDMPASLLNPIQSAYRLTPTHENALNALEQSLLSEGFLSTAEANYVLESVNDNNSLVLTIGDLVEIAVAAR